MISLNALITPGDNSIMRVAIKWGFHQDGQTGGGGGREAVIPPAHDIAANIVKLRYFGRTDQANTKPQVLAGKLPMDSVSQPGVMPQV